MDDNPSNRGSVDRERRINLEQMHEVRYWIEKFGVTPEQLREAVYAVGSMADAVEQHIQDIQQRSGRAHWREKSVG